MGVINLTPDSFSDAGQYIRPKSFKDQWTKMCRHFSIIDIGAESTAPMNQAITFEQEIWRYQNYFFSMLQHVDSWPAVISIDTYRPETLLTVYNELKNTFAYPGQIWWNDVSGFFDDEVIDTLINLKDVSYIFCHNEVKSREHTNEHQNVILQVTDDDIVRHLSARFRQVYDKVRDLGFENRVIWDPCFGFAKSKSQNIALLKGVKELFQRCDFFDRVLLGISRKSFLRLTTGEQKSQFFEAELLQAIVLYHILSQNPSKTVISRIHAIETKNAIEHAFKTFQLV